MPTPVDRSDGDSRLSSAPPPLAEQPRLSAQARSTSGRTGNGVCVREVGPAARIVTANAGDHPLVLQLLVQTRQKALAEDFQSRLDEPNYRPSDRLLVRREKALIAHVHVAGHIAWFEEQRVPVVKLEDFAVLPEYRDTDYDRELLAAAESIATAEGAVLNLVQAEYPDWFEKRGWTYLRGQGHTRASARAVLAHLDAQETARRRRRTGVEVRTWRHFELDYVRRVYDETAPELWGPLYRSEACWQWLIGRKAQDQVLLAVQRSKASALNGDGADHGREHAAGYAVVSGSSIVEMMTLAKFAAARVQLLARACREAMDRDHHSISLYTPAVDPLHELLVTAGGAWIDDRTAAGPRWMVRLLSPERWVERCYPLWRRRARAAGIARPLELGIVAGDVSYRFTLTRRSSRLEPCASLPAERIECDKSTFESLLIGNLALSAAITRGQLKLSHPHLAAPVMALFPPRLFWQSPLELIQL